jgi:hypothetical protein
MKSARISEYVTTVLPTGVRSPYRDKGASIYKLGECLSQILLPKFAGLI